MTMSNGTDAGTIRMHMPLLPSACGGIYAILEAFHGCIIPSPHAFFIFGDSLVDAGNNDYLVTLSKANAPPYGVDFSFSGGKPTGRFTNGRTIADVIGEALGQDTFAPPYLAPNSSAEVINSGANYASGSSGILDETGSFYIGRVPLGQQISYFEETKAQIVEIMGEKAAAEFLQKALFTVAVGSNDILEYLSPSIPFFGRQKSDPAVFLDTLVSNLAFHLKRLNELGARKFVIADVGPLGCIPYVRALEFIPAGECSAAANKLCEGYNKRLKRMINKLNQEMGPKSVFVYTNTHDIVMGIIRRHGQYGFDNALDPCCGGSFPPFLCIGVANSSSTLCEDRSKYVFWDAFHPTEAVNFIVAGEIVDGDAVAAWPINIRALFQY
ncbi:GDSL esterase/lipase At5g41890 isoform X2 [Brachypodium distachyon]|uniref:GDSL esterase/lipase At5g41890 isoform X2 n=1 Tax=Brachypodium distachyon TaxID=15368 RepID=UPI000D0D6BEF|nr:GDSL esterase/lipase At5g41890 isoform X2 [Brachypodium distachyon]|eukprot:XP_024311478.1 GDSL esterase/lipase At5g41890 isoform X2 [Brachypodium distachyon]